MMLLTPAGEPDRKRGRCKERVSMTSVLLVTHLAFAGIWLGCVLTEALFERALLGKGRQQELLLADLHKRVDLFIEIPAFVIVLITGLAMLVGTAGGGLLHAKIAAGLVAVAANVYCVWLVFRRSAAAHRGEWESFASIDHKQHLYGAVVLAAIVLALAMGMCIAGGA